MALTALVKGRTPPAPRKTRGLANRNSFNPCKRGAGRIPSWGRQSCYPTINNTLISPSARPTPKRYGELSLRSKSWG